MTARRPVLLFLVTEDWYFWSHRLELARAAVAAGYDVVVACRVGELREDIERAGMRVVPLERFNRRNEGALSHVRALQELFRLFRRERPAVLHAVAMKPVVFGGLAARLAGVPLMVGAIAGMGYAFRSTDRRASLLRPVLSVFLRLLLNRREVRVIVQNRDDRAALVESCGVAAERIELIAGSGVDTTQFRPTPEPPGIPVAALVGRLLWDKGVGVAVEASRLLRRRGIEARIALVGRPDPDNPTSIDEDTIRGWVDEGVVEWRGFRSDVAEVWREAAIALLPTHYGEGLPKSLLEAAAAGRAIVTTDAPGCVEFVTDGVNGLVVPQRDSERLAAAIERLVGDDALRQRLGAAARATVVDGYSHRDVNARILEIYRGR